MTTIGVALAVPDPWGEQLQDYRASLGDVTAKGIPTHITLMPPFEVEPDTLPAVEAHLADAAARKTAFRVHLRGTGTFRPVSPVVFVTVVRGISQCEQLAMSIRRGPLATELAFPYHPHVTVAHDVPSVMLELAYSGLAELSAEFRVEHFTEFEQTPTGAWAVAREYPLTGPQG